MRKALLLPLLVCLLGMSLAAQEQAPAGTKTPGGAPPDPILPIPLGSARPDESAFILGAALVLDTNQASLAGWTEEASFWKLGGPGMRLHVGRKFEDGSCLRFSWLRRCSVGCDAFSADYTTTLWESDYTRLRLRMGASGSTGGRSPGAGPQLALEGELYLGNGIAVHVTLGATLVLGEEGPRVEWEAKLGAAWYPFESFMLLLEYDLAQGYWLGGIELAL
jgi:hypothetical protein